LDDRLHHELTVFISRDAEHMHRVAYSSLRPSGIPISDNAETMDRYIQAFTAVHFEVHAGTVEDLTAPACAVRPTSAVQFYRAKSQVQRDLPPRT
jgi:hypothetical protein